MARMSSEELAQLLERCSDRLAPCDGCPFFDSGCRLSLLDAAAREIRYLSDQLQNARSAVDTSQRIADKLLRVLDTNYGENGAASTQ